MIIRSLNAQGCQSHLKKYNITYKPFGTAAILIEWPECIDPFIIQDIIAFEKLIVWEPDIADTIIAYNSLTVLFRTPCNFETAAARLESLYEEKKEEGIQKANCWIVPVCYDLSFGWDLEALALSKKLSVPELIKWHTAPEYLVYFIGFQPGFPYLGGLPEVLHTPRKANPRLRVPKGSVGIGGQQTGIYPQDSSGGWNIIGRTPVNFFDVSKSQPCFARAGDCIQFEAVDLQTYQRLDQEVRQGSYELKFTEL